MEEGWAALRVPEIEAVAKLRPGVAHPFVAEVLHADPCPIPSCEMMMKR